MSVDLRQVTMVCAPMVVNDLVRLAWGMRGHVPLQYADFERDKFGSVAAEYNRFVKEWANELQA